MACDRGEPWGLSPVRVPSVAEKDRRRLLRERRRLVKQRTMLANSAQGLLMLHGVFDLDPRAKEFAERLDAARTGYGTPLPPWLRAQMVRLAWHRLRHQPEYALSKWFRPRASASTWRPTDRGHVLLFAPESGARLRA